METEKNWLERNWKWLVPVSVFTLAALLAAVIFVFVLFIVSMVKSSDAYGLAMQYARANPTLIAAFGSPIEEGFFATGNISVSGSSGKADLSVPIAGPKASGTLYIKAKKSMGKWIISQLVVEVDGAGNRINLIGQSNESKESADEDEKEERD
ncbi:MAG: Cytochrome oxidase complex assembly protein 1 [Betaproteobacteria bacterium ADurb.Bin341]|nr:MAG: Cytochrome oxidase complex assembly protein 1 [Betaproteobacteria bacterium ADurb.Bin341]